MPGGGVYYMGRFCLLFVNIDHIAALREARGGNEPDLIESALLCEKSGCDGITANLRENRRPIKERDVIALREALGTKFNLEIPLSDGLIDIARNAKPSQVTLVPQNREERPPERGLNVRADMSKMGDTIKRFHDQNIFVSLSIEPDLEAVDLSKECGADFIEIHTGKYCNAAHQTEVDFEIDRIYRAAEHSVKVGVKVSAGHGLNYKNVMPVLKARALEKVTIGHSIICRSVFVGLPKAVEEMLDIIE